MNRDAHIENLNTPYFNLCACHPCTVQRKVQRVTNALQGKKKHHKGNNPQDTYTFGFSAFKQLSNTDDILDAHRYIYDPNSGKLQIHSKP